MPSFEHCYRAVESGDPRFDGWFYIAVTSTGIYCRPSCPATTPRRRNSRFYPSAAAAQDAGFRACRRCRPDAVPGSPDWDVRADVVARAVRLIDDGVVEREGVGGLATRLGYTTRHLVRMITAELGTGPLALARARRAHTARLLIETTPMPITDIAFAAGFGSVRQFNDTVRAIFAATPSELRSSRRTPNTAPSPGTVDVQLPFRPPYDADALWSYLRERAVPGLEELDGATYRRVLDLPHGPATVALTPSTKHVAASLRLTDPRDLSPAVARCRRLLHLDADPVGLTGVLEDDPLLGPLARKRPGLRVPGTVSPFETAVRAVVGQQVSLGAARTVTGRIVTAYGAPLPTPDGTLTHAFPAAEALAGLEPEELSMPRSRATTIRGVAAAVAAGEIDLDPGADREETLEALLALPGIGPWTASYVALRGLGDPDAFPGTDLGIRQALSRLDVADTPREIERMAERWRPLRGYAAQHLWTSLSA